MTENELVNHKRKFIADLAIKGAKIKRLGKMCSTCAFKHNSDANLEPHNVDTAAQCVIFDLGVFNCHKEIDVDAKKRCVGFLHAKQYVEHKTNKE